MLAHQQTCQKALINYACSLYRTHVTCVRSSNNVVNKPLSLHKENGVTNLPQKNYLKERKRALSDIHPCIFDLGLTVRVGAKLRC